MENIKAFFQKLCRWPGWTAWLHWKIWKRMAAWKGWRKLLYPPVWAVALAAILGFGGVGMIFWQGWENHPVSGGVYAVAFYGLMTVTARLIRGVPRLKQKMDGNPMAQKIREKKKENGAFGIRIYGKQFLNFFYGVTKIGSGVYLASIWVGVDGIYNFVQAMIQLYLIRAHKSAKDRTQQWRCYRRCGYWMLVLHLSMSATVFRMIYTGQHKESTEVLMIATAVFTFYKLISTFLEIAKDRKHSNPVDSAARMLNFSQALYNLFGLQVEMLWVFGNGVGAETAVVNGLTGGSVCLLVCGTGIYMLRRAKRDGNKQEETENGRL